MLLWTIIILKFVPFMGASPNALNTEPYKTPLIIPRDTAMSRAAIAPTAQECQAVHSKLSHFYQVELALLRCYSFSFIEVSPVLYTTFSLSSSTILHFFTGM